MPRAAGAVRIASAAVTIATLVLALLVLPAAASAGKAPPLKTKLKLKTVDQAALVEGGEARATVSYRGRKPKRMTLSSRNTSPASPSLTMNWSTVWSVP